MGCIQSTVDFLQGKKTSTVWACQYCSMNFATYDLAEYHERNECPARPQLKREDSGDDMTGAYRASQQQGNARLISEQEVQDFLTLQLASGAGVADICDLLTLWRDKFAAASLSRSTPETCVEVCRGLPRLVGIVKPLIDAELEQYRQYFVCWRLSAQVAGETFDSKPLAEALFIEKSNQQQSVPVLLMDDAGAELRFAGTDRRHFNELKKWCLNSRTGTDSATAIKFGMMKITLPPGSKPFEPFQAQTPDGLLMQLVVPGQIPPGRSYEVQYPIVQGPPPGKEACLLSTKLLCGMLSALDEVRSQKQAALEAMFPTAAQAVCQLHSHVSARCNVRHAKQAYLFAKQVGVTGLPELDAVCENLTQVLKLPKYWDLSLMSGLSMEEAKTFKVERNDKFNLYASINIEPADLGRLQSLFDTSFVAKYTRDRKGDKVPVRLEVQRAVRIQNAQNWAEYTGRQEEIRAELNSLREQGQTLLDHVEKLKSVEPSFQLIDGTALDEEVNCAWLFHGTSAGEAIAKTDFRIDLSGTNAGTMYGRGVYLAESCAKSDEYSSEDSNGLRQILVCRTILGSILYCDDRSPNRDELVRACTTQPALYHSVLGDREKAVNTFREFIVYDEDQVYPEFVVWYRRIYES